MTNGDNDPVMVFFRPTKRPRHGREVIAIVGQERFVMSGSVGELIDITRAKAAGISRGNGRKSACPHKLRQQHIHVFVEVKLDEKVSHGYFTKGSINSSGMRLRSIWVLISLW